MKVSLIQMNSVSDKAANIAAARAMKKGDPADSARPADPQVVTQTQAFADYAAAWADARFPDAR